MTEKLTGHKQLWLWISGAMFAPMTAVLARESWVIIGIAGAVCGALCWTLHAQTGSNVKWSKWFCAAQLIWTAVILSELFGQIPMTWPQTSHPNMASLILALLALWAVHGGTESCARTGSTLFWIVLALAGTAFLAAAKDVRFENVRPQLQVPDTRCFYVLLLPCAAAMLPRKQEGVSFKIVWLLIAGAAAIPFLTAGVLSPALVREVDAPFYELSRTLTLSGAAQRFEAVISAGMTVSWFLILCMVLSVSGEMGRQLKMGRMGPPLAAAAAGVLYLCNTHISGTFLAVGSVLFWGLIPALAQRVGVEKKL